MSLGLLAQGLSGLAGGFLSNNALENSQKDIKNLTKFRPQDFQGAGGFGIAENGNVSLGQGQEQFLQQLIQQSGGQLGGGLFNNQGFQNAFQNNDIQGSLNQAQSGLQQQAGNTAFGGLGGLFGQAQGLGNIFANQTAGGPQDVTGGLQNQQFNAGMANQQAAGDQSGLFNQFLGTQRAAASGGLLDQAINKLENNQFATGRAGTTGGGQQTQAFLDSLAQQDLGFQNNAFGLANQQQNFLGNLGAQQMQQGAGLLGQNLGQFQNNAQNAMGFGQQAGVFEGQGFMQALQALQQNQSAGNMRLQNAMGLFGQGNDVFNSAFGQGLAGQNAITGVNNGMSNLFLGQQNAAANRISASGQHAGALGQSGAEQGGLLGGIMGGIGDLFSDERLKDNVKKIGSLGELGWYEWDWNQEAHNIGAADQPNFGVLAQEVVKVQPDAVHMDAATGYMQVTYSALTGV